jgi:uncharacterized protein (TIGR02594 family)
MLSKRDFLLGSLLGASLVSVTKASAAEPDRSYREYSFVDYYDEGSGVSFGTTAASPEDRQAGGQLADSMPSDNPLSIMTALSEITSTGSTGEFFNSRWKEVGNPLIVRFFHDIGYRKTPYPGDCTPWCAATVSWCLKRSGRAIPRDPASSQSYLRYGSPVQLEDAKAGDICVFTDIGDPAHGHVGLFLPGAAKGSVLCLGGNQEGRGATNCGPGYRQSKIKPVEMSQNSKRQRSVSGHFLATIRRYA